MDGIGNVGITVMDRVLTLHQVAILILIIGIVYQLHILCSAITIGSLDAQPALYHHIGGLVVSIHELLGAVFHLQEIIFRVDWCGAPCSIRSIIRIIIPLSVPHRRVRAPSLYLILTLGIEKLLYRLFIHLLSRSFSRKSVISMLAWRLWPIAIHRLQFRERGCFPRIYICNLGTEVFDVISPDVIYFTLISQVLVGIFWVAHVVAINIRCRIHRIVQAVGQARAIGIPDFLVVLIHPEVEREHTVVVQHVRHDRTFLKLYLGILDGCSIALIHQVNTRGQVHHLPWLRLKGTEHIWVDIDMEVDVSRYRAQIYHTIACQVDIALIIYIFQITLSILYFW